MPRTVARPPRFTPQEWTLANNIKFHNAEANSNTAESLMAECNRLRDEIVVRTKQSQDEADKRLDQRVEQLEYWKSELDGKLAEVKQRIDTMDVTLVRVMKAECDLQDPLQRAKDCLEMRERRLGVDRVHDDPERQLIKEVEVMEGALEMLCRSREQAKEQLRRLRKAKYQLERDIERKQAALDIDRSMRDLSLQSAGMELVAGDVNIDTDGLTVDSWLENAADLLAFATREVDIARTLQSSLEAMLKQAECDVRNQVERTNRALDTRVQQTRTAKQTLEDKLSMVREHIAAVERTIGELDLAVRNLRTPLAKAQTRLRGRTERPCPELTNDRAQRQLVIEVKEIQTNADRLRRELASAQAQLRNLDRERLILEEDIDVKTNTLHICEGQCQVHRQAVIIQHF
ncbi:Tektin-1 [Amphibalanus amphitrite]|uniref:Tektin n=1 Tax=Amphibalanus amphitrite TaxID=1232801 RepID=A0A6A4X614_AMPAM|nr:tektin-1-like [Amphibalanus amphitrite]XP_043197283.1 tektin-1-like [Amphibalanus amphitrite]XP_043197284.1 tektin-1-like [Amphibalanus amphitrite]XP_043197285.1 tektin-1-like [Amphibalanus amphitrite]XP_043197286.1 tektin-1-like [Amphibalanus amphitrite]XP_043197287.1 tektin-1-like [Amphibalanus amphitrite]XP_043197288.1 tektin-1-like [Amphibalanus amphitrite]XP_043197289.1 tektin-1-like [Amphibalanus amphitrite]XP_043197290.1 tektin-1-like [Amphibalanus amphitrite]XP_043197291.1 tekti